MFICKSGHHIWTSEEDAAKCCNGWHRELRVAIPPTGETLPADAQNVHQITGADVGIVWVRNEADTLTDEDLLRAMFGNEWLQLMTTSDKV